MRWRRGNASAPTPRSSSNRAVSTAGGPREELAGAAYRPLVSLLRLTLSSIDDCRDSCNVGAGRGGHAESRLWRRNLLTAPGRGWAMGGLLGLDEEPAVEVRDGSGAFVVV